MKEAYKLELKRQITSHIRAGGEPVIVTITAEKHGRHGPRVIARIDRAGGRPVYVARCDPSGTAMSAISLSRQMVADYNGVAGS